MLDERKTAILRAIVQEYIATGQPVGSLHIAARAGIPVSSATIRNEMAVLEQEGYLAQRHTSGGRIPTDKGYRVFVDHLTGPGRLDAVATQTVGEFFASACGRLEELLHRTSNLLSQITNHTSVVVGPSAERARAAVRSAQIVALSDHAGVVVLVMSTGHVETQPVDFPAGLEGSAVDPIVAAASVHLHGALVGRSLDIDEVTPTGDALVDELCRQALNAVRRTAADEPVFVGGTSSMADAFDATSTVRNVLQVLEQHYVVVELVRDLVDRGQAVAIGAEHGVEPLAVCSVVVAPVVVEGAHVGTIGVLGPTRMDYPQALATVDAVSVRLAHRLGEGI